MKKNDRKPALPLAESSLGSAKNIQKLIKIAHFFIWTQLTYTSTDLSKC